MKKTDGMGESGSGMGEHGLDCSGSVQGEMADICRHGNEPSKTKTPWP